MAFIPNAGVDTSFRSGAVVAVAGIDGAFFRADKEGGGIGGGKRHACWAKVFCFAGGWGGEFKVFLRLAKHVDGPATDDTVGRAGYYVVGVLGADKGDGVDWVGMAAG